MWQKFTWKKNPNCLEFPSKTPKTNENVFSCPHHRMKSISVTADFNKRVDSTIFQAPTQFQNFQDFIFQVPCSFMTQSSVSLKYLTYIQPFNTCLHLHVSSAFTFTYTSSFRQNLNSLVDKMTPELELPGFRFHPTEDELLNFYLRNIVFGKKSHFDIIGFLNIYHHDPWELPGMHVIIYTVTFLKSFIQLH